MWARVDYCSVILFDSFPTSKARDHMALFVFTKMEYLETAKLREKVLSKIDHQYGLPEIEAALDEYVESVINNRVTQVEKAAPEMLEALEGMIWLLNKQSSIYCILPQFAKMEVAVKKAKGE